MFGGFLMEQGVEVELAADIDEVLDLLDRVIPDIRCDDFSYHVSSMNGVLGSKWKLLVRAQAGATSAKLAPIVGYLEIERLSDWMTSFKIPPIQNGIAEGSTSAGSQGRLIGTEKEEKIFAGFVFQLLNLLSDKGFTELPQKLPVL